MSEVCELLCLDLEKAEAIRGRGLSEEIAESAAARAKALSNPTRLSIAAAMAAADGELCVCDLAWISSRSDKLVSHHVRVLKAAGLVRSRRDGKMVMYALTGAGHALLHAIGAESAVG